MNDRIYELINQCFIGTTDGKLSELNTVANIEKFAELIVRECCEVLEQTENALDRQKWPSPGGCSKYIKDHFEIK